MSRFLLAAAAGMMVLTLTGSAQARGHAGRGMHATPHNFGHGVSHRYNYHSNNWNRNFGRHNSYAARYGHRFSHGYWFNKHNFYWNSRGWSNRYGCYCYWCPYANNWYYWYGAQNCYYPINYISIAPPVGVVPPALAAGPPAPNGPDSATPPAVPPLP